MSRFKFRVWQTEPINKMKYKSGLVMSQNQLLEEDCKVMQCTGLKDYEGNLIYEGDILKTYPILASDKIGDQSFNVVVEWSGSSWLSNGILGEYQCRISKVIGNIYENPELLEKPIETTGELSITAFPPGEE